MTYQIFKKIFHSLWALVLSGILFVSTSFAVVQISIDSLVFQNDNQAYQWSKPWVTMTLRNDWNDIAYVSQADPDIPAWWITCQVGSSIVYSSNPIGNIVINPLEPPLQFSVELSNLSTQTLGNHVLSCMLGNYPWWEVQTSSTSLNFTVIERLKWRFDDALDASKESIQNNIDGPIAELWKWGFKTFIFRLIDRVAVPIAVFMGILLATIALYKIMFSQEDNKLWQISWMIARWVVGIIIILSAKFIWSTFYNDILSSWTMWLDDFNTIEIVRKTYNQILWPLLKIAFYIMISVLFVILLIRVFSFVTSSEEDIKKKSWQIIISTSVGLLIMIGAKQLVEWVYGKEEQIIDSSITTVSQIGSSFLSTANIPIIYDIIQWIMGLSGFIILAIIILQTYQLLVNPTSTENTSRIRNTLLYSLIGILVIGVGYLIVNVLLVN